MTGLNFAVKNGLDVANGQLIANSSLVTFNTPINATANAIFGGSLIYNGLLTVNNNITYNANVTFGASVITGIAAASDYRANTANKLIKAETIWSAATFVSLTDAATILVDFSTGINFTVTIAGNRTLGFPSNAKPGQTGMIEVVEDSTGGRTLAFAAGYLFNGGSAPSADTTANRTSAFSYYVRSSGAVWISLPFSGVR